MNRLRRMIAVAVTAAVEVVRRRGNRGGGAHPDGEWRPVVLGDDVVEAIVHDTVPTVPEDGSACWSTRSMGARYGIG